MGTLGVILKTHYACGSVIRKVFCRVQEHWMSYMSRCVKRSKMNEVRDRKIEKYISVGTLSVVALTCGVVCAALIMAFKNL